MNDAIRACYAPLVVACVTAATMACGEVARPAASGINLSDVATPLQDLPVRPREQHFKDVSDVIPEFAGYFIDDGRLVAILTDLTQAPATRTVLAATVQRLRYDIPSLALDVVVRKGDYTFEQLRVWRDRIYQRWPDGMVLLDLDEGENRVEVGIDNERSRSAIMEGLQQLGVPALAVQVRVATLGSSKANARRHVSMPQSVEGTLRDTVRPLLGGTAIRLGNGGCTLGFLAEWAGTDALVTSSHCTIVDWALDSTTVHQPVGTGSPIEVGFEVHDPNGVTCGGDLCRASDAAVIKVPTVSSDLGYIARTIGTPPDGYGATGSITIDAANPKIAIVGKDYGPPEGITVHKLGAWGGWTTGTLVRTCIDVRWTDPTPYHRRNCQDAARYGAVDGDSGALIFKYGAGQATVLGLHWKAVDSEQFSVYSPILEIEADLGYFEVRGNTPLSVGVTQLALVPEGVSCTWEAMVSGGTPPYAYQWSGLFTGSGPSVSGVVEQNGTLYLTVTDAANDQGSDQIYVEIDPDTWDC